jgi:hypothetical protein
MRAGQIGAVIIGLIGLGIWLWARRCGAAVQTE